jgi:hypothetical protein
MSGDIGEKDESLHEHSTLFERFLQGEIHGSSVLRRKANGNHERRCNQGRGQMAVVTRGGERMREYRHRKREVGRVCERALPERRVEQIRGKQPKQKSVGV